MSGKVSGKVRGRADASCWEDEVGPTIRVAVDDVGPLVYAVQNGMFEFEGLTYLLLPEYLFKGHVTFLIFHKITPPFLKH